MHRIRLTASARRDVANLLDWSFAQFGAAGRQRYETLIATALRDLAANALRIGSRERPELGAGLRSYHIRLSRERTRSRHGPVRSPRHIVFYRVAEPDFVVVLRVLHEAMDLSRHLPPDRAPEDADEG